MLYFLGNAWQGQVVPAELTWLQRRAPPNDALLTEAFRGETHYLPRLKDEG